MSEKSNDLLKGLFIGGLIGMALGILFAPKSGKETREDITRKANDLFAKAKKNMKKLRKKANRLMRKSLNI